MQYPRPLVVWIGRHSSEDVSLDHLSQLIRRAQARDAGAFDEIIDLYGPRLYGYFYRLCGARDDAEDLLQELFLRVLRTIDRYEHDGQLEAWLFRIATNLIRDRYRRAKRTPDLRSLDSGGNDRQRQSAWAGELADRTAPSASEQAEAQEDVNRMQRALAQLPRQEREAVMLRHFSQLSFAQIADVMATPLGTALARVHRGLAKLRKLVDANT